MGGSIIADNWSLQTVAELLTDGLVESNTAAIQIDRTTESHTYVPLPQAAVSFEALFDLIADLVLRDQVLVDEKFTDTWLSIGGDLNRISERDLIRPIAFLNQGKKLDGPRAEFVHRLCMTSSIKALHQRNVEEWDRNQETPDQMLSSTLWGGAGMLARAFINEKGYTPHPLRRRLFQQANLVLRIEDGTARLNSIIEDKHVSLSKATFGSDTLYSLRINLPPIPVLAIREARDASQLLPIALQLREEFQGLREWLREYQQAITSGDPSEREPFEKILRSISTFADSRSGKVDPNTPTFTVGLGVFKVALKADPMEFLRSKFGVRANANRLLFSGSGTSELSRLLGFFGHRHSPLALKLFEHFSGPS